MVRQLPPPKLTARTGFSWLASLVLWLSCVLPLASPAPTHEWIGPSSGSFVLVDDLATHWTNSPATLAGAALVIEGGTDSNQMLTLRVTEPLSVQRIEMGAFVVLQIETGGTFEAVEDIRNCSWLVISGGVFRVPGESTCANLIGEYCRLPSAEITIIPHHPDLFFCSIVIGRVQCKLIFAFIGAFRLQLAPASSRPRRTIILPSLTRRSSLTPVVGSLL